VPPRTSRCAKSSVNPADRRASQSDICLGARHPIAARKPENPATERNMNAESTLGTGADRARVDRGGRDRRDAAPRALAHRLRGDVRGADGVPGQGALARAGPPRQPRLGAPELQREPRQPPPGGRADRAGRDPPLQGRGRPDGGGSDAAHARPRSARPRPHRPRNPRAPMEIAQLVEKEGGDLRRTIMCHICRTITDVRAVIDLAQTGLWLEYDLFGLENSYYPYQPAFDMPNDGGRMAHVLALIE